MGNGSADSDRAHTHTYALIGDEHVFFSGVNSAAKRVFIFIRIELKGNEKRNRH